MGNLLTKYLLEWFVICRTAFHLHINNPELRAPIDESQAALIRKGNEIGEKARELFPGGIDATENRTLWGADALNRTSDLMKSGDAVLYEAAFQIPKQIQCRVDILVQHNHNTVSIFEVKSGSKPHKPSYLFDVAVQTFILRSLGYIVTPHLITINTSYVCGDTLDIHQLFKITDVSAEVATLQPVIHSALPAALLAKTNLMMPQPVIGKKCFDNNCPFYEACFPKDTTFDIGGLQKAKAERLFHSGIKTLSDIDSTNIELFSKRNQITINAMKTGRPRINKKFIRSQTEHFDVTKPHFLMDFESRMPVLDLYPGLSPYQNITFQFCVLAGTTGDYRRIEFLAEPGYDCRRDFITALIEAVDTRDESIFVYNIAFERSRLEEIRATYNDLDLQITNIISRLKDVMIFFSSFQIHYPEQKGRYSIKKVLPILAPHLSYENLEIKNGAVAMAMYERMPELPENEKQRIRDALKAYCHTDVAALGELLPAIFKLSK